MKASWPWIALLVGGFAEFLWLNPGTRIWLNQALAMWQVLLRG